MLGHGTASQGQSPETPEGSRSMEVHEGSGTALTRFDRPAPGVGPAAERGCPGVEIGGGAMQVLSALRVSMEHVRAARSVADTVRAGTRAVCLDCGFERVVFFSVRDSKLEVTEAFFGERADWAHQVVEIGRRDPTPLTPHLKEAEALRRRRAILVQDPMTDPDTPRSVVVATQTTGYVAAPIVIEGRVVGFVHADRHFSGRPVDDHDRQLLWAFAEGFGAVLDAAAIRDRAEQQRREIARVLGGTPTDLWAASGPQEGTGRAVVADFIAPSWETEVATVGSGGTLTRREHEILRLLAAGRTNAAIADELVVTVNTVKSHVKHIMRKLGAANRAEAAAMFHRSQAGQSLPSA